VARLIHRSPGQCVGVAARVAASRQHWSRRPIYALRGCSRALLAGLKPVLASCSQVADGGGRWLLITVRGHLGGTPVTRRPSPARPWSLCVAPLPSRSFTPAWRSRLTIPGRKDRRYRGPPRMIRIVCAVGAWLLGAAACKPGRDPRQFGQGLRVQLVSDVFEVDNRWLPADRGRGVRRGIGP
jgi:hypothetical protein